MSFAADLPPAYPDRAAWGTAPALRAWQSEAIDRYFAAGRRDFLAVATPGARAEPPSCTSGRGSPPTAGGGQISARRRTVGT